MSSFHQVVIGGYPSGGLMTDQKPLMLPDEAFSSLQNAYVFRKRTKKREGTVAMGRLRRFFSGASIGVSTASPYTIDTIYSNLTGQTYFPITPEPNAEIAEGTVVITIGSIVYNDQGNGDLTSITPLNSGTINYLTGVVVLTTTATPGTAVTITFGYFPSLPSMGIWKMDVASLGIDATVFFDTKYAYQYITGGFQELVTGETWTGPNNANGTNTFFFWSTNFQGIDPNNKVFFTTNNNIVTTLPTSFDPIRYYNPLDSLWHDLTPLVSATDTLFQALILIPYYGRLLALNTWEGPTAGTFTKATNFYARCRFSQIGDPIGVDSWRSDIFGLGGFLDAPTNESIVSVAFHRNTLIVFFEYSTWQLRYIGEYGLPFIFERISSDFGATSTFSPIVFDGGALAVGGRGIIQAGAGGLKRIDVQIPETVFSFSIQNNVADFVHGVRDFEKEIVYWNYLDASDALNDTADTQVWPNTVLLYNYQNNTWAQFRDTITCFGVGQFQFGITWDSLNAMWDDYTILWDNVDDKNYVDYVLAGNQQGFISIYENQDANVATTLPSITMFSPTLAITAFDFTVFPTRVYVPNHNLADLEIIYIQDAIWSGTDPGINNQIYQIKIYEDPDTEIEDPNSINIYKWNQTTLSYDPVTIPTSTYIGGGLISLLPRMNIQGKDFSPFQEKGIGYKLSFIDFQMDSNPSEPGIPAVSIQLFVNASLNEQANLIVGVTDPSYTNRELLTNSQICGFISNVYTGTFVPLINPSNPCQITSINHGLFTGKRIYIANILGTTQLNAGFYIITVVDANNFTLNGIDATGFTPYLSGGIWNTTPIDGQAYIPSSQYAWYRFYSNQYGQYLRIGITYDDILMNQLSTHQLPMEMNAMMCHFRPGARLVN